MPRARANGIELEYETFGDSNGAPLILIMGLGAQMISWDEAFCELLVSRGFYVIRFDNRDAGLSTKMDAAGPPDMAAAMRGDPRAAYTLDEMAADAVGVLDALDIRAAHVVGASMGGYIAQLVALNHPERVLTLTSIMSGPAPSEGVAPTAEAAAVLLVSPPATRQDRVTQGMWIRKVLIGPGDPFDEVLERDRAERAIDRAHHPVGTGRQLVSVLASSPRLERLRSVEVATLVIHGTHDGLIPVENGRMVAAAVPGARLIEIEGMGHDLPRRVWPEVADAIAELAGKEEASKSARHA